MWCLRKKVVNLVELTVLHEDSIDDARVRNIDPYKKPPRGMGRGKLESGIFSNRSRCRA